MRSIPRFDSDWTRQMSKHLRSCQGDFGGAEEWVEWLIANTQTICRSWGDTDKWDRPKAMLTSLIMDVGDMMSPRYSVRDRFLADMETEVNEWAKGGAK